eukprot:contig_24218_g5965
MREAELKHCRITMLACLGFFVQEAFTLPASYFPNNVIAVDAHDYFVNTGGMQQLLLWFCFAEFFSLLAVNYTMQGGDREPGDFSFDPLNMASTPAKRAQMELSEIKNGRLAMIGIGGLIHQEFYSHKPVYHGPAGPPGAHPQREHVIFLSFFLVVVLWFIFVSLLLAFILFVPGLAGWSFFLFLSFMPGGGTHLSQPRPA